MGSEMCIRDRTDGLLCGIISIGDVVKSRIGELEKDRNELLARVRAALRTAEQPSSSEVVVGDLRLDLLTKVAWRGGQRIELAPREWALLELFMRHPHQVLSRAQILSSVWDQTFETGSNVVDVYVGYLRRKLNKPGLDPLLVTVRGAGYRFVDESADSAVEPA